MGLTPTPRLDCICGGYGSVLYQTEDSTEVAEEPCGYCLPPSGVKMPQGPLLDAWGMTDKVARKWEAMGRGKWDLRKQGDPDR